MKLCTLVCCLCFGVVAPVSGQEGWVLYAPGVEGEEPASVGADYIDDLLESYTAKLTLAASDRLEITRMCVRLSGSLADVADRLEAAQDYADSEGSTEVSGDQMPVQIETLNGAVLSYVEGELALFAVVAGPSAKPLVHGADSPFRTALGDLNACRTEGVCENDATQQARDVAAELYVACEIDYGRE